MENKIDGHIKEIIYDIMNDTIDSEQYSLGEGSIVKNEFEEGEVCSRFYEEVYKANMRICERLGVQEDEDVELIISNMTKIAKHLSMKMYDYGAIMAKRN